MKWIVVPIACILFSGQALAQSAPSTCVSKNLQPIMETHTLAPYPPGAVALAETGTTLIRVVIGADGAPSIVSTIDSSGFEDLDTASTEWIKAKWRWRPLLAECQTIETRVTFKWDIADIGRRFSAVVRLSAPKSDHAGKGATTFDVLLSDTGEIVKTRVVNSSGDRSLDMKAAEVLRLHKFQPALVDGQPATSAVIVEIDW